MVSPSRRRTMELVEIRCQVLFDSGEAILIYVNSAKHWIPLSQVGKITRLNGVTSIYVAAWLAKARQFTPE